MTQLLPAPFGTAMTALGRCVWATGHLLARRAVHLPATHVGCQLRFADGTTAVVYRETTVDLGEPAEPCVLVVSFRLRWIRGWGHRVFRWESLLNTPLFVGFPGFVSKLWLAHDQNGVYRGLYQWDGADRATSYVRALWWALIVVSDKDSLQFQVIPNARRDAVLTGRAVPAGDAHSWWQPVDVEAPAARDLRPAPGHSGRSLLSPHGHRGRAVDRLQRWASWAPSS